MMQNLPEDAYLQRWCNKATSLAFHSALHHEPPACLTDLHVLSDAWLEFAHLQTGCQALTPVHVIHQPPGRIAEHLQAMQHMPLCQWSQSSARVGRSGGLQTLPEACEHSLLTCRELMRGMPQHERHGSMSALHVKTCAPHTLPGCA